MSEYKSSWYWKLLGFLVILSVITLPISAREEPISPIKLAADYLSRIQLDSGFFLYQYDFIKGRYSLKNNIVRQAGTAYSLAEYQLSFPDADSRASVEKALSAFKKNSVVWKSGRLLTLKGNLKKAKSGATALALLTNILLSEHLGQAVNEEIEADWLEALLALQMEDGGFEKIPSTEKQSAYSNGEIWLALAYYDRLYPNTGKVIRALVKADNYFTKHYVEEPDIGFFHWGVMAASIRYETTNDHRFADFIARQLELFMVELKPKVKHQVNSCYSVEGLLSGAGALHGIPRYGELYRHVTERVAKEMEKNRKLQILPLQDALYFSEDRFLKSPDIPQYSGAFLNGKYRPQVRIDATQHCLSAMVKEHNFRLAGE